VLGLHFFSPVPVMALVEIVRALDTSAETVERAHTFVARLGKHAIETKDRSGFVVNFLLGKKSGQASTTTGHRSQPPCRRTRP
jgi:3-hydroxybutyryl-CoA dehydrogenase